VILRKPATQKGSTPLGLFVFGVVGGMPTGTKADKPQIVQLILQAVNTLADSMLASYTSVSVARLKADVFSAAYAAHIQSGALPEEARSIARATADYMYGLVESK